MRRSRGTDEPHIIQWLAVGGLNSDGMAPDVADLVLRHPSMLNELLEALRHDNDRVRGHAADALERVSREKPLSLLHHIRSFIAQAKRDPIPMVRWHLAMVLGNLAFDEKYLQPITRCLLALLGDPSPFVKAWAISGLCLIGRKYARQRGRILRGIVGLGRDPSKAVRVRAQKAVALLTQIHMQVPPSWVKSSWMVDL